ncbi:MAG: trimethylamine methyltransferase family protein [Dethiobacter sp.]|nr:trimethylamine methyltransferase family protein [Dethiobacter sp.]
MDRYVRARYQVNQTPLFQMLSADQCGEIYLAALEILQRTGAKVYDRQSREILAKAGCWVEEELVRFPVGLTEWAVKNAPSKIVIYNREGQVAMSLQEGNTYYGPGPTNTYHRDPYTGERRKALLSDTENVGRVCDALPHIDYAMDLGTPTGVTNTLADLYAFSALVKNTRKPIVHWGFDIEQYQDILDIGVAVAGGLDKLQQKPFFCLYSEPSSPLLHSREAIAKAVFAAQNRIPIVYTPCVMLGATTPATLAGTIAMGVAESLVGIVVSQLIREGSPIIMGGVYAIMDMKTTVFSYGSPEFHILQAGIAEVARYMGIPVFGTAGCTDSHTMDGQAAGEAAMSILIAAQAGANLVHDVGYTGSGSCGSLEQLVLGDEIIGMVRRFMRGMVIDDETLALDVVDKVGPGGHFLGEDHTMKHFKSETWFPTLFNRMRYHAWKEEAKGSSMGERIKDKLHAILANHQAPALPGDVLQKIEQIIIRAEEREASKKKRR